MNQTKPMDAGPPEEVFTGPMKVLSRATPMLHTVRMLHQPWLGLAPGWSWLVFGALVVGRWRYGWRGRKALRWILAGTALLILAYLGSKFVLEVILGR